MAARTTHRHAGVSLDASSRITLQIPVRGQCRTHFNRETLSLQINVKLSVWKPTGKPEQKDQLLKMMKQHADQVSRLRADKRELIENVERQTELLSATLQVLRGLN